MNSLHKKNTVAYAFTLTEVLAALAIGTMILAVVLAIFSRAQNSAVDVYERLERNRMPREILQRISDDIERIAAYDQDVRITFENKFQDGYSGARLEMTKQIQNAKKQPEILERVIWQSGIEPEGIGKPGLTIYRSHSGLAMEDNLLDSQKEPWQRELFVPICSGLTHFSVITWDANDLNNVIEQWMEEKLPPLIIVSLSTAEPQKNPEGRMEVAFEDIIGRTIATDRTRKPKFTIPEPTDINKVDANNMDANSVPGSKDPNDKTGETLRPSLKPRGLNKNEP